MRNETLQNDRSGPRIAQENAACEESWIKQKTATAVLPREQAIQISWDFRLLVGFLDIYHSQTPPPEPNSTIMFRKIGLAALSLLPLSLAQITSDFESGWDQTTWATYAPDCNQGGTVSLDTTKAHSGSNSIKVAGAGGYCGHAFFGTTKVPSGDVYVRVWM